MYFCNTIINSKLPVEAHWVLFIHWNMSSFICLLNLPTWSCDMLCVSQGMLIEYLGRKVLIMGGYALMSVCCVFFTLTLTFQVSYFMIRHLTQTFMTDSTFALPSGFQPSFSVPEHGVCFCLHLEFWLRTR